MTSIGSPSPFLFGGKKAYEVERSLRFDRASGDMTLDRTPSSSGNQKTWTFSAWIKRASLSADHHMIFEGKQNGSNYTAIYFSNEDKLRIESYTGSLTHHLKTSQVSRDINAWQHIVVAFDTTEGTASNRIKLYVNGMQVTDFDTASYPSQDYDTFVNSTQRHDIGRGQAGDSQAYGGYIAEINLIDGFQYDSSYFGETDPITGQWNPKKYVGSYGTNGFYLNFSDNSGTTATTMGKDSSGNGNNFTPNNLAVSDAMKDSPTNNFAVMNPLTNYSGLSQGNLRFNNYNDSAGNRSTQATIAIPKSGKWYLEARYQEDYLHSLYMGLSQIQMNTGYLTHPTVYYDSAYGTIGATGESNVSGGSWYNIGSGNSVILSIAIDVDNNSVKFYKDNSLQGTITLPTLTASQEYFFTWANSSGGSSGSLNNTFNFGADSTFQGQVSSGGNTDANGIGDFKYAPPSGHLALCSANLPDPTIKLPNKHFDTVIYTGDGSSSRSFSNVLQFQPDWIWLKIRSAAYAHLLYDAVRGAGSLKAISSSTAGTEGSPADNSTYGFLSSFDANGFTVTNGSAGTTFTNQSSATYVAWNWNGGNSDTKTYTVTVVSDSGNKYRFDGFGTSAVTLDLAEGGTYIFNYPSAHPFRFSTTSDGTHGGGTEYTTGVTVISSTSIQIVVAASAPTLYYYCSSHSGMGGAINTNSTLGSSNFDGSLQATVKANTTAGFSIGTYTAQSNGSATVGHGLAIAPDVVITKSRTLTSNWYIYHKDIGQDGWILFTSGAATTSNSAVWNPAPTSSVFTYGSGLVNQGNIVFYAFSEVPGYSKFGSYTGNGSTDGTFVFTGFRPAFILWKPSTQANTNWVMVDNKRDTYNVVDAYLLADVGNNVSGAEGDLDLVDFLSNGFKLRQVSGNNESGQTIIYLAFAESPFKNSRAR